MTDRDQRKGYDLLEIHGFVPLGPHWKLTDVLVCDSQWRTLPNLMRGTYGQSLLAEFFKVDLHVMQEWIEMRGYPAEPQGYDLVLDVKLSGHLQLIAYSSDQPTTVDCLMRTETGRMLVQSELTGDTIRKWDHRTHAREAIEALSAARASKTSRAYQRGCFDMIGVAMGWSDNTGK